MLLHPAEIFVDGGWAPAGGTAFAVVNPASEEVVGHALAADDAAVAAAVTAARHAFDHGEWPHWDLEKRIAAVEGMAAALEQRAEEIAQAHTAQMGAPIAVSRAMVGSTARLVAAYVAGARHVEHSDLRQDGATWFLVERRPVGVVAAVTPWNGPLAALINKVVPALLAGCTMVLKPAPETPFEGGVLAEAAVAAGVPAGVLNVVTGAGPTGEALVRDPRIDKVTFTGSTAVGHRIGEIAGRAFVRQSLELGGKSAAIVLEDADIAATVPQLVTGNFFNSGQACIAVTRVVVPRSRAAEFVDALATAADRLVVGDPLDGATDLGPLVSARQRERVEGLVAAGVAEGATLVTGGHRPAELPRGFYLRPAVFAGVDNGMRVAREEIFGPVLSVLTHTGEDDAVALANDSPYGLHGAVFSADPAKALGVARRLRTGSVTVNGTALTPAAPYGGVKGSGIGREHGAEGYAAFLEHATYIVPESLATRDRRRLVNGRIAELHPEGLRIAEYPVPDPEPGGLVVRVEQATVCGSDLHVLRGDTDATGLPASILGFGHEGFGRIVALGEGTTVDDAGQPLAVGDRVVHHVMASHTGRGPDPNAMRHYGKHPYFFSTFADHLWIGATRPVFRVPDALDDTVLAPVNCAMGAAVQALAAGGVGFGSRVVVLGAGGLGVTAVAAAKHLGAGVVVAQDLQLARLDLARAFGADAVVDAAAPDRVALVKELTNGGADVVLDFAGLAALLPEGAAMLARGGTFVEVGLFFPGTSAPFDPSVLLGGRARLVGSAGYPPALLPRILAFLVATADRVPWARLVGPSYGLDDLGKALDAAVTTPARVVVRP